MTTINSTETSDEINPSSVQSLVEYDPGRLTISDYSDYNKEKLATEKIFSLAQNYVNTLFELLYKLPKLKEYKDVVILPPAEIQLPREKPFPTPLAPTKWQVFAAQKGIKKHKRERMIFDEASQEFRPRYGYKRANDPNEKWAIEAKANEDPSIDPWTRMEQEKKERVKKNKKKQAENIKAASGKRVPGTLDLSSVLNKGDHVSRALEIAQTSTASMDEEKEKNLSLINRLFPDKEAVNIKKETNKAIEDLKKRSNRDFKKTHIPKKRMKRR